MCQLARGSIAECLEMKHFIMSSVSRLAKNDVCHLAVLGSAPHSFTVLCVALLCTATLVVCHGLYYIAVLFATTNAFGKISSQLVVHWVTS